MKKILVANWKMNPTTLSEVAKLISGLNKIQPKEDVEVVICPSFVHLPLIKSQFSLGAQDVFIGESGAFTGEVSSVMLKKLGVQYVIIGHSERRINLGESDELIARKVEGVLRNKLQPILCVGESGAIRKKGFLMSKNFVLQQLKKDLSLIKSDQWKKVIVAYEPIWAISTMPDAKPDSPEEAAKMISEIKKITNGRVLYGGSVNAKNAASFLEQSEIDGALVGGASLKVEEFKKIITSANLKK